jgi:hypothetical protein
LLEFVENLWTEYWELSLSELHHISNLVFLHVAAGEPHKGTAVEYLGWDILPVKFEM